MTIDIDEGILCKVLWSEFAGKYFTKPKLNDMPNLNTWCLSKMDEIKYNLIMCEVNTCKITWLHCKCMRIKKNT